MRFELDLNTSNPFREIYRWALYLLPVVLAVVVFYYWGSPILQTLSPFALAFVLAYLLNPVIDIISGEHRETRKVHRGFAILGLYATILVIVLGFIGYLVPLIVSETAEFARKARDNYLPSVRRELSPKLKEWFTEESLLRNPRFVESGNLSLEGWQALEETDFSKIGPDLSGTLIRVSRIPAEATPVLRTVVANVIEETSYTLRSVSRPSADNIVWSIRLSAASSTDELDLGKILAEKLFPIPAGGEVEERVSFPDGTSAVALDLIANGSTEDSTDSEVSLSLFILDLLNPPPVPFLDSLFWKSIYEDYASDLNWSQVSNVMNLGARGAGVVAGGAGGVWSWLANRIGGIVSLFIYLTLLLVILFYMLLDFTAFKRSCVELLPLRFRPRALSVAGKLDEQIGGFIRGQATICLCVGLLVMFLLLILRVPFAIPIGLLAGAFNFVPYLGPAMGMVPALTLTTLEFFDPSSTAGWVLIKLGMVFGAFMLVQMVDGFFLSPKIMSESVDVSPLVVMGALMLGGGIAGVTGMVLAIPTYCALRVAMSEYRIEMRALRMKWDADKPPDEIGPT